MMVRVQGPQSDDDLGLEAGAPNREVVARSFNPNTQEAGRSLLSSSPAWSTELIPGQQRLLDRETLSQKT